jgi:hypothetical protein
VSDGWTRRLRWNRALTGKVRATGTTDRSPLSALAQAPVELPVCVPCEVGYLAVGVWARSRRFDSSWALLPPVCACDEQKETHHNYSAQHNRYAAAALGGQSDCIPNCALVGSPTIPCAFE